MSKTFNKNIQYTFNPQITLPTSSGLTITGNSNTIGSIFTTGGNVGIGTTAPSTKLHLRDNGSVTLLIEADADNVTETDVPTIKIRQDGGTQGMDIGLDSDNQVYIDFGAGTLNANTFNIMHKSVPLLQITTSGNVGIGTTSPLYSLQVDGNVALNVLPGIGTTGSIKIGRQDFDARWHMINVNTGTSASLNNMIFSLHNAVTSTTIAPVLTLRGDGNVGIGTTAPSFALDIAGSARVSSQFLASSTDTVSVPGITWSGDTNTGLYHPTANQIGIVTAGVERIRVSGGNIGIGTTAPTRSLEVRTGSSTYGLRHSDGTIHLDTYIGGSINGAYFGTVSQHPLAFMTFDSPSQMIIQTNGNVGIGTTAPSTKLDVNGGSKFGSLGSTYASIRSFTATLSTGAGNPTVVANTITYPVTYTNAAKLIIQVTITNIGVGDTFAHTIKSIGTTSMVLNVVRIDSSTAYAATPSAHITIFELV